MAFTEGKRLQPGGTTVRARHGHFKYIKGVPVGDRAVKPFVPPNPQDSNP
jgi:hypothetical protein